MLFKKRASLEISIQAIVIIVLAMTLLGLGLGFIRGLFGRTTSLAEDVSEQVRQKILDDLITGDKKVSFPKTDINIDKGGSTILTVGVRNKKDTPLHYKMIFTAISGPENQPIGADSLESWFQYAKNQPYTVPSADAEVRNIRLSVPTAVSSGSYFLTFDVIDDDLSPPNNIYAQKDFFIVVRG